jgi:hypothetical protein
MLNSTVFSSLFEDVIWRCSWWYNILWEWVVEFDSTMFN